MRPKRKRFVVGLVIALSIGGMFCAAFLLNLFSGSELRSRDLLFVAPEHQNGQPDMVRLIAIDDQSLAELGNLSLWPRSYYAELIDILVKAKARVIVFDVLFAEPAPGDEELARAIKDAGNVVLPIVESATSNNSTVSETAWSVDFVRPLSIFEENAAIGHASVLPDGDGGVRRLPIVIRSGEGYEPALALTAVAKYLRRPAVLESPIEGGSLAFAGRLIPVDNKNDMFINYTSTATKDSVVSRPISFVDVLGGGANPAAFEDKIVIIGAAASGLADEFWTPLGRMKGVQIHASAIETILKADFLRLSAPSLSLASILALALLSGLVALRLRVRWAILSVSSLAVGYFLAASVFFDKGVMLNMFYPPLAIVGAFVGVSLYNVATERSQRDRLTKTFGRYVSPSVASRVSLALDQGELRLGGDEQEITVAFADVRGFTGIAKRLPPQRLMEVLNRHLAIVMQSVLKYEGMVNKFGGDSVMAVWNAPTVCERHPLLAIRAAMAAQDAIRELHEKEPTLLRMDFGIGINTGMAIAGNVGSEDRMEYSVIGDAVNTAARLTAAAPGGKVWLSADTFELAKDYVSAKPLSSLQVKGKEEIVVAYEVVGIRSGASLSGEESATV